MQKVLSKDFSNYPKILKNCKVLNKKSGDIEYKGAEVIIATTHLSL